MAADKTIKIIMRSSASHFFFTTTKNKANKKEKMVLKRYDPVVRKHVEFNEEKMR